MARTDKPLARMSPGDMLKAILDMGFPGYLTFRLRREDDDSNVGYVTRTIDTHFRFEPYSGYGFHGMVAFEDVVAFRLIMDERDYPI